MKNHDSSILRFISHNASDNFIECSFDRKRMSLQCALSPTEAPLIIGDFDKQPARLDTEVLDGLDLGHGELLDEFLVY